MKKKPKEGRQQMVGVGNDVLVFGVRLRRKLLSCLEEIDYLTGVENISEDYFRHQMKKKHRY